MGILLFGASVVALFWVTRAIYHLYLHPLARYPGPTLWVISRIPYLICMNRGSLPYRIRQLHEQYGPVVRLGVDELSFNDSRAWKDIYTRKDFLRPPQWGARPPGITAHSLISAPADDHARFRKAMNPAFSEKATRDYESAVRSYMNKLLSLLGESLTKNPRGPEEDSKTVDLVEWANLTTFDIIGEIVWSKSYECLDAKRGHAFMSVLMHFQAFLVAASIKYYPWLDQILSEITPKSAFRVLDDIFKDSRHRFLSRLEMEHPAHPDLVGYLKDHQMAATNSEKLSGPEIEQNLLTVVVGGSETLTSAISGAFHQLLAHPAAMETLVSEVRSSFEKEADISAGALSKLPYLNAVIDETLRLCPPFPDALRRLVPPTGAIIAGRAVDPGTTVSVSCYSMFRSPKIFTEPDAFIPARWLDGRDGPGAKEAFHPFAVGPHNCLGQPLARMELRLFIALLLWRYDIRCPQAQEMPKWEDQKIYWTWEKTPLEVVISKASRVPV
ncbi:cytochrome P450 ClCP1 [Polyplosphaeria fusca]|uniref:Cytochrome P450 ClCP1 n=1 Tax=Polyplosphaeria fusca TaxID=682080 RepID=A0A9P4QH11_9PLEO|nr:cytochrome P450 ClCP1 [Polyplosphaeria fusca]